MSWTDESFQFAADLGGQGYSGGYIAKALSREFRVPFSRNAVIGKLTREGIPFGVKLNIPGRKLKSSTRGVTTKNRMRRIERLMIEALHPVEPPAERPKPAAFLGLTLMELTETTCRFPRGDNPYFFCGQPVQQGSAYCPGCHAVCYDKRSTERSTRGAQLRELGQRYSEALRDAPL